jgi:electron transfer flavoprotein beta subunit
VSGDSQPALLVGVALKWQIRRPQVDPLTGTLRSAELMGPSESDLAALEWALRLGEAWGAEVLAACAGPPEAEPVLRDALAAGASRAVLVALEPGAEQTLAASALAGAFAGAGVVVCGAHGLDRGSGAVPAVLAAELGAAQALGLLELQPEEPGTLRVLRRLHGGRRERLRVRAPAVISVEGGSAPLRRAALPAMLRARTAAIEQRPGPPHTEGPGRPGRERLPDRPRPRIIDPPSPAMSAHERVLALHGETGDRGAREVLEAGPPEAAEHLLATLERWGYR